MLVRERPSASITWEVFTQYVNTTIVEMSSDNPMVRVRRDSRKAEDSPASQPGYLGA